MASSASPEPSASTQVEVDRPWACDHPGCHKSYTVKASLLRHMDKHIDRESSEYERRIKRCPHVDEDGKPCGHETFREADMEKHMRTHTRKKPYQCRSDQCAKTFSARSARILHERKDHGVNPAERRTHVNERETKGGSSRFTPYPIRSESIASSSAPSSSGSGYGRPQSSLAPTSTHYGDAQDSAEVQFPSESTAPPLSQVHLWQPVGFTHIDNNLAEELFRDHVRTMLAAQAASSVVPLVPSMSSYPHPSPNIATHDGATGPFSYYDPTFWQFSQSHSSAGFVNVPLIDDDLAEELFGDHVRSMLAGELEAASSSGDVSPFMSPAAQHDSGYSP